MASFFNGLFGGGAKSDVEAPPKQNYLGEAVELSPEEYDRIEPMFPHIQQKDDPTPRPVLRKINFEGTKLERYHQLEAYASVIDNAFTLKECDELVRIAEASSGGGWPQAQVNIGMDRQILDTSYRKGDRILYDDKVLADKLLDRIGPLIKRDIAYLDADDAITGTGPLAKKGTAAKRRRDKFRMTRLNERLRYLRYPATGFFKMHCDGAYTTPDHKESSLFTFHLYLNDKTGDVPLKGGATRFWELGCQFRQELPESVMKKRGLTPPAYYDVEPIPGRVLVFQHAFLLHSGEPITEGIKMTIRTDFMYERIPPEDEEIEYRKHLQRNGLLADEIPVDPKDEVREDAMNID
ncbi:hypothetical protein ABW19_dt0205556 [Dactylella cylindrospora]|nr:hypothetical protein ABW19_dt0205556 [Dactylella cylindrospora]